MSRPTNTEKLVLSNVEIGEQLEIASGLFKEAEDFLGHLLFRNDVHDAVANLRTLAWLEPNIAHRWLIIAREIGAQS